MTMKFENFSLSSEQAKFSPKRSSRIVDILLSMSVNLPSDKQKVINSDPN